MNFDWNTAMFTHLCICLCLFLYSRSRISRCNRERMAHKAKNTHYRVLYRESLLTPGLKEEKNDSQTKFLLWISWNLPSKYGRWHSLYIQTWNWDNHGARSTSLPSHLDSTFKCHQSVCALHDLLGLNINYRARAPDTIQGCNRTLVT
jgi:hypothetical protein